MSVRFDAAGDRISYSGTLPNPSGTGLTLLGWWRVRVDRDDFSTYCRISTSSGASTVGTLSSSASGLNINYFTGGGSVTNVFANAVDEWFAVAAVLNGTACTVYVRTESTSTISSSNTVSVSTPDQMCIGGRSSADSSEWFNGAAAYVRIFAGALTQAQVEAEWNANQAVLKSNLFADWPLTDATNLRDISGNGRNLSAGSTAVSSEGGPQIRSFSARFMAGA